MLSSAAWLEFKASAAALLIWRACNEPWFPSNQEVVLGKDEGDEHVGVLLGVPQLRHEARRAPLRRARRPA